MLKLIVLLVLLYLTYQVVREALGLRRKQRGYFQRVYRDLERRQPRGWRNTPAPPDKKRYDDEVEDASWEDVT
ncbi:MAG: hypothetical protein AAF730_07735 [Bacteroidota bacterium]